MQLFDAQGKRLYLTAEERRAFMAAARKSSREVRTLCALLHNTGARISETLELTPARVDLAGGCIVVRSLKKTPDRHLPGDPGPGGHPGPGRSGARDSGGPAARQAAG